MKQLLVTIPQTSIQYPIIIGSDILENISEFIPIKKYSKIAIITDKHIQTPWLEKVKKSLSKDTINIILSSGEKEKTIDTVMQLWKTFQEQHMDRKSLIINLGGGVIGDMGGFAASTYMRGLDFLQIPTSLLSQVDASVGGKVGINFNGSKNAIGSFQQPVGVIIDIDTLRTLPKRAFAEGFGEIIKHGLIADKEYFSMVTSKNPEAFSENELAAIITNSVEIKRAVIEQDEKEGGYRKILNFGHTIGHALESASFKTDTPLLHGEAVLLGMIAETTISHVSGLLPQEEAKKILDVLQPRIVPIIIKQITKQEILEKITNDKKNEHGAIKWTLLSRIGSAEINQIVSDDIVQTSLEEIIHE